MMTIPKDTAYLVMFMAFLSTDHVTGATGKIISIDISKNGGAFAPASAATATEVSGGWYKVLLSAADVNTAGPLAIKGTEAATDDVGLLFYVAASHGGLIDVNAQLVAGAAPETGSSVALATRTEMDSNSADLNTIVAGIATITAKTNLIPATPAAVGSAMTLSTGERDAIANAHLDLANGVETGRTPRQALRAIAAAAGGVVAGAGTSAITIAALGNPATPRIATTGSDEEGNRPTVTLTL